MFDLLSKLSTIHFAELDADEILDKREMDSFDSEWVRVYQAVEDQKRDQNIDDTKEIREKAFMIVYQQSGCGELAEYISDDFGLIADSKLLSYSEAFCQDINRGYYNFFCNQKFADFTSSFISRFTLSSKVSRLVLLK